MAKTKIEWTNASWSPCTGCTPVSDGCKHCWAAANAKRFWSVQYPQINTLKVNGLYDPLFGETRARRFSDVQCHPERLKQPYKWNNPRRIAVCLMGDLFHKDVPTEFIKRVVRVMQDCPRHIFQVLTKRPERLSEIKEYWTENIHVGVSVEDQLSADKRIIQLLNTDLDDALRFVSIEPMLGPVNLLPKLKLDWVILGCESGPGRRPMKLEWARSIRDECQAAGVPLFVKQLPAWPCEGARVCHDMSQFPTDLQIREFPDTAER